MKLFLASEAKHPDSFEKLKQFVGGLEGKRIVYIPTAANGHFYGSWKQSQTLKLIQAQKAKLEIIELENSYYTNVLKDIGKPDIIWFPGGMPGYLLYWIRRVELDKALPEILNSGTFYVGSSAGSMICSQTQKLSQKYIGESEPGAEIFPGLGLIDFEIYPHFQDELKPQIEEIWDNGKVCLLKDGEAIRVEGDQIKILGEERFLNPPNSQDK